MEVFITVVLTLVYSFFSAVTLMAVLNGTDFDFVEIESLWWINFMCVTVLWPVAWIIWLYWGLKEKFFDE